MEIPNRVIDERGYPYTLATRLGRGGQGEVWRTENGRHIVKLYTSTRNPKAVERQLSFVRRLDLAGLPVARPLSGLRRPLIGYVAEFLDEMGPIKGLLRPAAPLTEGYNVAGGLRRRARLLAHAGEALLTLHGRGLIYGDLSADNLFVSDANTEAEAWLIDLDNLRHTVDPELSYYTPRFGAPEVVEGGAGCSALTDVWSFAVLAHWCLRLVHPFIGDAVDQGDPELEEQAMAGHFPWVDHSDDDRNRSTRGIPGEMVLTRALRELFHRCFEDGLAVPARRPGLGAFVERLHAAADQAIACPACGSTYLVNRPDCPWCDTPKPVVCAVRFHRWEPDVPVGFDRFRQDLPLPQLPLVTEPLVITRRTSHLEAGIPGRRPVARLTRHGGSVELVPEEPLWQSTPDQPEPRPLTGPVPLRLGTLEQSARIHFGPPDRPHRVAIVGGSR